MEVKKEEIKDLPETSCYLVLFAILRCRSFTSYFSLGIKHGSLALLKGFRTPHNSILILHNLIFTTPTIFESHAMGR